MGYIRLRSPPPRTYESLRATFRRPQELVTTETVDIAAAAAAAAEAEDDEDKKEARNLEGVMEDGHPNGISGSNGAVGVGGYFPVVSSSGMVTTGNAGVKGNGYINHGDQAKDMEADKLREAGEESGNEDDDQQNDEFVPDVHMRRGETACRKLCVEGVSPLLNVSRVSPATSEALGGEETEEVRFGVFISGI